MTINVSSVGRVARLEINNTQIIFAVTLPFKWQLSAAGTRGFWHVTHPKPTWVYCLVWCIWDELLWY